MEQEIIHQGDQEALSTSKERSTADGDDPQHEKANIKSGNDIPQETKNATTTKDTQIKPRKRARRDDGSKATKKLKLDGKKIPNIAEELAKNRNIVRGSSPTSLTSSSCAPITSASAFTATVKGDSERGTPEPADLVLRKEVNPRRTQVKISSLLSPNGDNSSSLAAQNKSETESSPVTHTSLLMQASQSVNTPKVILPTQLPGSSQPDANDIPSEENGVLIARISSPVSVPPQSQLKRSTSSAAGEHKTPSEKAQKSNTIGAIQSRSKQTKTTGEPKKRNTKTGTKRENGSSGTKKDGSSVSSRKNSSKKDGSANGAKKDSSMTGDIKTVDATTKKDNSTTSLKKENSAESFKLENSTPGSAKASDKNERKDGKLANKPAGKKEGNENTASNYNSNNNSSNNNTNNASNKSNDAKKKITVKRESSSTAKPTKTPKKLIIAPPIKSPSLLEVIERGKTQEEPEEPALIVDIPLYSAEDNDYLDENGQVVFNFYKIVQDKFSPESADNLAGVKSAKRNLFGHITGSQLDGAAEEEDEDIEEVDEDGEDDEDEEGEEPKQNASPKKKSHPNKGKSLIGKYDTEDPFIDDTELLWEEQRAATKDGFFVYFGPLIEKGHYASLERADGTMKRGGVKNK
ncbi:HPC2 (YBR215W) [Zygosaccharomyces parabailii]|nr:HPC2 (YBR215W) [Zygosaccharomyces parabailii]